MIDLRQVQAFVAVVEAQSFTRAAQRLHIGQSGLSAQIKKLEATVGGQLFDRTPRSVETTQLGRDLFVHAQDLLASAQRFLSASRAPGAKALVTLAIAENGVNELALTLLGRLRSDEPDIDLEIRPIPLRRQHEALADGVDALIARPPFDGRLPDDTSSSVVGRDPLQFLVHIDSDLGDRSDTTLSEVLAARRISTTWVPDAWADAHAAFAAPDAATRAPAVGEIAAFRDAAAAVSIQRSACVMPASFAATYNVPDVVALPIRDVAPMSIELIIDERRDDAAIRGMLRELLSIAEESDPVSAPFDPSDLGAHVG